MRTGNKSGSKSRPRSTPKWPRGVQKAARRCGPRMAQQVKGVSLARRKTSQAQPRQQAGSAHFSPAEFTKYLTILNHFALRSFYPDVTNLDASSNNIVAIK